MEIGETLFWIYLDLFVIFLLLANIRQNAYFLFISIVFLMIATLKIFKEALISIAEDYRYFK
jgi:hypothetical protein